MACRWPSLLLVGVLWGFSLVNRVAAEEIVIYSGRSKNLVQPVIAQFEKESGITVKVRYGSTAQMAIALAEEGVRSPADLFWAQDAGALGAAATAGLFEPLPQQVVDQVPAAFRHRDRLWVATSGRARVLAHSSARVSPSGLPTSVFDLVDPKWQGRVGWSPANGSFQAFVTALRKTAGERRAEQWLRAMSDNGAKAYPNNTAILQAIAAEEIDLGLPNHYYLLRFRKADSAYPVSQTFFKKKDIGNLVFVSGIGRLKTSRNPEGTAKFVQYLLSPKAQQYFTSEVFEYPMTDEVISSGELVERAKLLAHAPDVDVNDLEDLKGTLELLRKVGLQ